MAADQVPRLPARAPGSFVSGLLILGGGGHGKVVADILLARGEPVLGFLDDDAATWGTARLDLPVLGGIDTFADHAPAGLVPGLGANAARKRVVERLGERARGLWRPAIHPGALVAPSARIGQGVVVAAGAVINPDAVVGDHAIVNTGATVDHDCVVGAYAHLAPGTHLAGGVRVGDGTLVGIGSVVIPYRSIGHWSVVGAGAVVVRDIPDGVTAKGLPARW
jgi:sugar O-acyltransferase (sialic acid O-acetyltransferase NeuD family)